MISVARSSSYPERPFTLAPALLPHCLRGIIRGEEVGDHREAPPQQRQQLNSWTLVNNKGSVRSSDWARRPTSENLLFQEHCAANEFDLHQTGDQTERHYQPPPHTPSSGLDRARCTAPPLCQQVGSLLFRMGRAARGENEHIN